MFWFHTFFKYHLLVSVCYRNPWLFLPKCVSVSCLCVCLPFCLCVMSAFLFLYSVPSFFFWCLSSLSLVPSFTSSEVNMLVIPSCVPTCFPSSCYPVFVYICLSLPLLFVSSSRLVVSSLAVILFHEKL